MVSNIRESGINYQKPRYYVHVIITTLFDRFDSLYKSKIEFYVLTVIINWINEYT